jgi:hypothetical protein
MKLILSPSLRFEMAFGNYIFSLFYCAPFSFMTKAEEKVFLCVARAVICFGWRLLDYSFSLAPAQPLASLIEMCEKVFPSRCHTTERKRTRNFFIT